MVTPLVVPLPRAVSDAYDPCPEGAAGVVDIGCGVRIRMTSYRDVTAGLIESHPRPDNGARCSGAAHFDVPETEALAPRPRWRVVSAEPLTLEPSLLCSACGHHGWVREGRWVPA
jgi:hypothetical protein